MPTWLTGLLVSVWIARSAPERPLNSHRSPVAAVAIASSRLIELAADLAGTQVAYAPMRIPWKLIGVAGVAGVAATGVVIARRRREEADVDPEELRARLHERLAEAAPADE
jgi:hypothetical protein